MRSDEEMTGLPDKQQLDGLSVIRPETTTPLAVAKSGFRRFP